MKCQVLFLSKDNIVYEKKDCRLLLFYRPTSLLKRVMLLLELASMVTVGRGRGFDPRRVQQHSFVETEHGIFSAVILSLPLIPEGQLSVFGERMCTSTV